MPVCVKCDKESNNLRMCPFCHAEYPVGSAADASRKSKMTPRLSMAGVPATAAAAGRPGVKKAKISPAFKFYMPALIVGFCVWYFVLSGDRKIPVGVVLPNIVTLPMSHEQAAGWLQRVNSTATIEPHGADLTVTFPAAMWPERRDGQLALAQQYARAAEIMDGKKRNIEFKDPSGSVYAKAAPEGVMMVK